MKKRPIETKYLSVKDYLEYEKIYDRANWSYEELDKFLASHNLPTTEDIKNENLRMYVSGDVRVEIYHMDLIKKTDDLDFN